VVNRDDERHPVCLPDPSDHATLSKGFRHPVRRDAPPQDIPAAGPGNTRPDAGGGVPPGSTQQAPRGQQRSAKEWRLAP